MGNSFKTMKHYEIEGHAHSLAFSCFRRYALLGKDRTRFWFTNAIADARVEFDFDLWAWVFLPDHAHLLIHPRRPQYALGPILQAIKQPVGMKAIHYLQRHAPAFLKKLTVVNKNRTYRRFWQPGGGYDGNRVEPAAIHEAIDYFHNNPVRAGLVEKATDWKWSSARDWADWPNVILSVDRNIPSWLPGE
jgi:putative transposase